MKYLYSIIRKKETLFIYSFIVLFFVASSVVSVLRYYQFQNFYFDFGIFDRSFWLVSHFHLPIVFHPNFHGVEKIIFADHFNPSMFLLAPLYWITDKREVFLIAQSFIVCLSAVVAYRLAKQSVENPVIRVALVLCYCLFVGLQNALISDIHDATLATLPLMIAFWAVERRKWKIYFLMMFLILGLKESFAGLMVGIGFYILWRRHYMQALLTILFSLAWFYLVVYYVIPYFSGQEYFYASGANANLSFITLLTPFIKIKTLFFSFLSFGFLPLFYPPLLPAIFENFFERFSTLSDTRWGLALHYSATLSPLFFMSSLRVVAFLEKKNFSRKLLSILGIILIVTTIILHRFILHGPLGLFYNGAFYQTATQDVYLNNFIMHIPKTGLIMTQNDIAVRLTHYNVVLLDSNITSLRPDVVALNLTPGQNPNVYFPESYENTVKIKNALLINSTYTVKKYGNELYLFLKK